MAPTPSSASDDVEAQKNVKTVNPEKVNHMRLVFDRAVITPDVLNYPYKGSGTEEDPYLVEFIDNDPRNPMDFPVWKKWFITISMAFATLAVAFVSSAYSGTVTQIIMEFHISEEVATLGIALFVLGFAIGPLFWAPLSEMYGRQILFFITYGALTAFNAGAAGAKHARTLIVLRFMAGAWGSSPLTNAGGVIADMFQAKERGLATALFASAPFMGPAIGPIVGGFAGETIGWRWVEGIMAIFTGTLWIFGSLMIPETYAPFLLRTRATKLSKQTGKVYISALDKNGGKPTIKAQLQKALIRPWQLLLLEPIVLLISIYMAIIYGTLYMLFGAFPIVFQETRGWSEGIGGLAFLGVAIGILCGTGYMIPENKRYGKISDEHDGMAPPENRLPGAMVGSIAIPVGLFWFAWTNYPSIHWIVCIIGTVPFGFGIVLVFLTCMNYLIDAYTIYAASVLAANSVLRSLFGAAFPLFTTQMYDTLGIHWASSIPAFLAIACVPFPFFFYKYGPKIRLKCKYAAQAAKFMQEMKEAEHEKRNGPEQDVQEERAADHEPNVPVETHESSVIDDEKREQSV